MTRKLSHSESVAAQQTLALIGQPRLALDDRPSITTNQSSGASNQAFSHTQKQPNKQKEYYLMNTKTRRDVYMVADTLTK